MYKFILKTASIVMGVAISGVVIATPVVMNFGGLNAGGEYVSNYYNGACGDSYEGGAVHCNGPNFGVSWTSLLAGGAPDGFGANTSNEPSPPNVAGNTDINSAFMNVAAGFSTGFSFYYAAAFDPGSVAVYSGLNGTGDLLATLDLPVTGSNCDDLTDFSCWSPIGVSFLGTAESADFSGATNGIVLDNVTLSSSIPVAGVPAPGGLALFGLALVGFASGVRRHRRSANRLTPEHL